MKRIIDFIKNLPLFVKIGLAILVVGGLFLKFRTANNTTQDGTPTVVVSVDAPIEEGKLVRVLADIHEAETLINAQTNPESRDSLAQTEYSKILTIHHIQMKDLDSSLNMYLREPNAMEALEQKVNFQLGKDESSNR